MQPKVMNTYVITNESEKFAKVMKSAREADRALTSMDGALSIVTKYWNNNGYNDAARELGYATPSAFAKAFRAGANGKFHASMFDVNKKGVSVVGVWRNVKVYDTDPKKAVVDANGRTTHPYMRNDLGEIVTRDVWREVTRWTPATLFEIMVQSEFASMLDTMDDVATEQNIAPENVEYLAQRAVEKLHAANKKAAKEDLQPVLNFTEPAAAATEAPTDAPAATAAPAPKLATRKPAAKKATATRKPAAKKATKAA